MKVTRGSSNVYEEGILKGIDCIKEGQMHEDKAAFLNSYTKGNLAVLLIQF